MFSTAMAESNLQLDAANSVFARVEWVRKSEEELSLHDSLEFDLATCP